jgi:hypothetical protein
LLRWPTDTRKIVLGHALLSYLFGTGLIAVAVSLVTNLGLQEAGAAGKRRLVAAFCGSGGEGLRGDGDPRQGRAASVWDEEGTRPTTCAACPLSESDARGLQRRAHDGHQPAVFG